MATRQIFGVRVIDAGNGTGKVQYQLDGSGIAEIPCTIRKEAWAPVGSVTSSASEDEPTTDTNK